MERPSYLSDYLFNWDVFDIMLHGKSALDSSLFVDREFTTERANEFLQGYGFDSSSPVSNAELFGTFQESLQFIKRYFLKDGNPQGLDFKIPMELYSIINLSDLFVMASPKKDERESERRIWAEMVLKVMHTILHIDKDIRSNYFPIIQTQIFDRFYKYLHRDENNNLFLGDNKDKYAVRLLDFQTKANKSRDSVIIKLLHKSENVAEEVFDRVGIRFITKNRFDTLRVLKFLVEKSIIIPHNAKVSRSSNSLVRLDDFRPKYVQTIKKAIRENLSEEDFLKELERSICECTTSREPTDRNLHTKATYRSLQFTCRQLIKYVNPFFHEFNYVRQFAKELDKADEPNLLAKKVRALDISLISRDVRFFYPFEVQIVDQAAHAENTEGEASHSEYKKAQLNSAMLRIFRPLIAYHERNKR